MIKKATAIGGSLALVGVTLLGCSSSNTATPSASPTPTASAIPFCDQVKANNTPLNNALKTMTDAGKAGDNEKAIQGIKDLQAAYQALQSSLPPDAPKTVSDAFTGAIAGLGQAVQGGVPDQAQMTKDQTTMADYIKAECT